MKKLLTILIFFISFSVSGQGINFFEGSWHDALELAKKENKLIFVDAYTSWCGPCKRLKTNVFPQKEAGEYYNKNFINLSIDLEKWRGLVFSLYYKVNAYPTLLFIDPDGNIIHRSIGYKNVSRLIKAGKKAIEKYNEANYVKKKEEWYFSKTSKKIFKKLLKSEKKKNQKKFKKYAFRYYNLIPSDSLKREFIKFIYDKPEIENAGSICYELSKKLYKNNPVKHNKIFLIKILTLTKHNDEAYGKVIQALKNADAERDIKTRIELRRYKKHLARKQNHQTK